MTDHARRKRKLNDPKSPQDDEGEDEENEDEEGEDEEGEDEEGEDKEGEDEEGEDEDQESDQQKSSSRTSEDSAEAAERRDHAGETATAYSAMMTRMRRGLPVERNLDYAKDFNRMQASTAFLLALKTHNHEVVSALQSRCTLSIVASDRLALHKAWPKDVILRVMIYGDGKLQSVEYQRNQGSFATEEGPASICPQLTLGTEFSQFRRYERPVINEFGVNPLHSRQLGTEMIVTLLLGAPSEARVRRGPELYVRLKFLTFGWIPRYPAIPNPPPARKRDPKRHALPNVVDLLVSMVRAA